MLSEADFGKLDRLPPLLAILVWDVLNDNVTAHTIALAFVAMNSEFNDHPLARLLAGGKIQMKSALTEEAVIVANEILGDI